MPRHHPPPSDAKRAADRARYAALSAEKRAEKNARERARRANKPGEQIAAERERNRLRMVATRAAKRRAAGLAEVEYVPRPCTKRGPRHRTSTFHLVHNAPRNFGAMPDYFRALTPSQVVRCWEPILLSGMVHDREVTAREVLPALREVSASYRRLMLGADAATVANLTREPMHMENGR